jgi:electron transport complex protein RnfB
MSPEEKKWSRRDLLSAGARGACLLGLGGLSFGVLRQSEPQTGHGVWQLDPWKCIACGKCATHCVLKTSAVKCVHSYPMCGYCDLCTGYFEPEPNALNTGAENQLCPVGAIRRRFIEDPYFEYDIDEDLCIGCGKCVKGCTAFGNGSLYLQIRHNLCKNCNECAIATVCPAEAFRRVPAELPYLLKIKESAK